MKWTSASTSTGRWCNSGVIRSFRSVPQVGKESGPLLPTRRAPESLQFRWSSRSRLLQLDNARDYLSTSILSQGYPEVRSLPEKQGLSEEPRLFNNETVAGCADQPIRENSDS
jgi:hypothetical protein